MEQPGSPSSHDHSELQHALTMGFIGYRGSIAQLRMQFGLSAKQIRSHLDPIFTTCIRKIEKAISQHRLRRKLDPFGQSQIRRLMGKFYQISYNKLYGTEGRVNLALLYKLLASHYDASQSLTNAEVNQIYEGILDLNLAVDEETHRKTICTAPWSKEEEALFCEMALQAIPFCDMTTVLQRQFNQRNKFVPSKLQAKLTSIFKAILRKIKTETVTHLHLSTLISPSSEDIRRIVLEEDKLFEQVRHSAVQYFLREIPNVNETERIIKIINSFLEESKKWAPEMRRIGADKVYQPAGNQPYFQQDQDIHMNSWEFTDNQLLESGEWEEIRSIGSSINSVNQENQNEQPGEPQEP